jgi:hypothetical protein
VPNKPAPVAGTAAVPTLEYVRGVEVSGHLRPGKRGGLRGTVGVRAGDAAPVRVEL